MNSADLNTKLESLKGQKQSFSLTHAAAKFAVEERDGKMPLLTGYAMTWNTLSDDRGGYKVKLAPNSAKPSPNGVFALCNHDFSRVLASTKAGTLKYSIDAYGLKVEIDPADTSYARDMIALIRRGDVAGMSFSLLYCENTYEVDTESDEDFAIITYSLFQFDEVTITAIPAFTNTSIASEFAQAKPPVATPNRNRLSVEIAEMDSLI